MPSPGKGLLANVLARMTGRDHRTRASAASSAEGAAQPPRLGRGVPSERNRLAIAIGQLDETLRPSSHIAVAQMIVAASTVILFWDSAPIPYLLGLFAVILSLAAVCFVGVRIHRRAPPSMAQVATMHTAVRTMALTLGLAWGTLPITLYDQVDADGRSYVVALCTGLLTTPYILGPIRYAASLFTIPVVAGSLVALAIRADEASQILAILLVLFACSILFNTRRMTRFSTVRIADRVQVIEQNETISLLLNDFTENASEWLWETDPDGRLQNVSHRLVQMSGLPAPRLLGAAFEVLFRSGGAASDGSDAILSDGARDVVALVAEHQAFRERVVTVTIAGAVQWWRLSGKPLYDGSGRFLGMRGVGVDITAARESEARIAHLANHDSLTGLANRALFQDLASMACERAERTGRPCALLYLDLDGFKIVNDTFGHAVGDTLLTRVAARLGGLAQASDLVARLGGDEFAILYPCPDADEALALARLAIERLSMPYIIDNVQVEIGVSIGIALAPDDATKPEVLLGRADLALYRAKAAGRGEVSVFTPDLEISVLKRRDLEVDLKRALAQGELSLHYQPLVGLERGEVRCFEALLRWNRNPGGPVSPADFIPVAEASGLISQIGRWVLHQACQEAALWPTSVRIAVNLSPIQFRRADLALDVFQALETSGLAPNRLELEITESVFFEMNAATVANLRELRALGVRIALDDFGTGYSSLSYLIRFPVDKIKIDRSFIKDMDTRHECLAIIEAILTLAAKLSITVTAEGVETIEQAAMLRALGCDDIQGFLFSPGRPGREVEGLIATLPGRFAEIFFEAPETCAAA